MNDFQKNRSHYKCAERPFTKGNVYVNNDGERIRYHSDNGGSLFHLFKWADKPNPDGPFMVSWFYEKRKDLVSNCCSAKMIGETSRCSSCKENATLVRAD